MTSNNSTNNANGISQSTRDSSQPQSALDLLRRHTNVDCDTLDPSLAAKHKPFVDCTSNQAIAYNQLISEGDAQTTAAEAARLALEWKDDETFAGTNVVELGVEIAMALLSLRMLPYLSPHGFAHIQVNPLHAYSTSTIIANALRIIEICRRLLRGTTNGKANGDRETVRSRICIKIPSTLPGLHACRVLEMEHGIRTLATTLFGKLQGACAGMAGCRYIAPYLHGLSDVVGARLDASTAGKKELQRMLNVVVSTQRYYRHQGLGTQVLPAALMSVDECLVLRGVDHMTLPPKRIEELDAMSAEDVVVTSLFDESASNGDEATFTELEEAARRCLESGEDGVFEMEMRRWDGEMPEKLLADALAVFGDFQRKLEEMMRPLVEAS